MAYPFKKSFIAYRLLKNGNLIALNTENIIKDFQSVQILAFYFFRVKRLYIWVGPEAPRDLKNLIPLIEDQVLERNPTITILRHFTIEGYTYQTQEFLQYLNVSEEEYKEQLSWWEQKQREIKSNISKLEENLNKVSDFADIGMMKQMVKDLISESEIINDLERIKNMKHFFLL